MTLWCRFAINGASHFGIVDDEYVVRVDGSPFEKYSETDDRFPLGDVSMLVPVMPGTFYAIGSNYSNHVVERSKVRGTPPKFYDRPRVGYRANSALVPTGADIVKPRGSGPSFQYEGELVAVIGRTARRVSPQEAWDFIFGWTIGNDVTERDWQKNDPTNLRGKNADSFKPMGPYIATGIHPSHMTTTVRINGEVAHEFDTGNMLFDAGEVISAISETNTLSPGDVVWLGTDELPRNLVPGDRVDISISGIGTLSNNVVSEDAE
ncbi:fumarylacetoacetate hydrolase family protein [Mesorhizobium sp. CAU 1741]|uniref:fumarylacetoacetate hydrolase family protein n=1 Tax=Mesorhizobium sp. CAU 1741 TaxID=3140366 RepID=UPI00325BBDA8